MQFRRNLEVRLVKASDKTPETPEVAPGATLIEVLPLVNETALSVFKYAAMGVGGYILADTLRQVIVKLTPTH